VCGSLKETIIHLEERTEALESAVAVEHARAAETERGQQHRRVVRRARSVPGRDRHRAAAANDEFRGLPSAQGVQSIARSITII